MGEGRDHDIIGFHNWVQFYLQEKIGNIDYRGFFRRGTVSMPIQQSIQLFLCGNEPCPPYGPCNEHGHLNANESVLFVEGLG